MPTRPNDEAFPTPHESTRGMTLREYLAAQAMGSMSLNMMIRLNLSEDDQINQIADLSVRMADALIRRLNGVSETTAVSTITTLSSAAIASSVWSASGPVSRKDTPDAVIDLEDPLAT